MVGPQWGGAEETGEQGPRPEVSSRGITEGVRDLGVISPAGEAAWGSWDWPVALSGI